MLSVSTTCAMPRRENAWTIPTKRLSCLAFGKNSAYRSPHWWHTITKHAHRHAPPASSTTSMKPQSIWYILPGGVVYLRTRPTGGSSSRLRAGTRSLCCPANILTVVMPPRYPTSLSSLYSTEEFVTPCASSSFALPACSAVMTFPPAPVFLASVPGPALNPFRESLPSTFLENPVRLDSSARFGFPSR